MADEPNDPPIGTAQNAADVARKAELEEAVKVERIALDEFCAGDQRLPSEIPFGYSPVRMVSLAEMRKLYPDAPQKE